ncbi:MAG: hypothetical protein J3R72DRAFT_494913 [Linnemannia gamsii]|nr:MAG: hypothetical protein J3R72DRAFT_494913 [Linnemannia gamsii]
MDSITEIIIHIRTVLGIHPTELVQDDLYINGHHLQWKELIVAYYRIFGRVSTYRPVFKHDKSLFIRLPDGKVLGLELPSLDLPVNEFMEMKSYESTTISAQERLDVGASTNVKGELGIFDLADPGYLTYPKRHQSDMMVPICAGFAECKFRIVAIRQDNGEKFTHNTEKDRRNRYKVLDIGKSDRFTTTHKKNIHIPLTCPPSDKLLEGYPAISEPNFFDVEVSKDYKAFDWNDLHHIDNKEYKASSTLNTTRFYDIFVHETIDSEEAESDFG